MFPSPGFPSLLFFTNLLTLASQPASVFEAHSTNVSAPFTLSPPIPSDSEHLFFATTPGSQSFTFTGLFVPNPNLGSTVPISALASIFQLLSARYDAGTSSSGIYSPKIKPAPNHAFRLVLSFFFR